MSCLPSGKRLHNYGKSPFSMEQSTIICYFQVFRFTRGYVIDVDAYDTWQKFQDLLWRLARNERATSATTCPFEPGLMVVSQNFVMGVYRS